MKYKLMKCTSWLIAVAGITTTLFSCSKWDDFKQYVADGEIPYTGKLSAITVYSGNERVRFVGQLPSDPKVTEVRVFWNDHKDSAMYTVDPASDRVFDELLETEEGIKSFAFYTYDASGNKSVALNAMGRAYGPRYQNTLSNRLISSAVATGSILEVNWIPMDMSAGPIALELVYPSATGEKTQLVAIDEEYSFLDGLDTEAQTFSYRTLFLPQAGSIDTFYTDYTTAGIARDVTDNYLVNTRIPFATSAQSERWAIPAHWTTNAAVRNFRHEDGNYYGGVDRWFGGLAMEAGWSEDNMATIVNGKLFQTTTLPIGIYTFEMEIPAVHNGSDFYTVAAAGKAIPDIENLSSSLAFLKTSQPGVHSITFTITEPQAVSLGFVGNLENRGCCDGTAWQITRVGLKQQILLD